MSGSLPAAVLIPLLIPAAAFTSGIDAAQQPLEPKTGKNGDGVVTTRLSLDVGGESGGAFAAVSSDPHLEPGFPAKAPKNGGSYLGGASAHTLVGNVDEEPTLEIFTTALAIGPLLAWNADGTPLPGWPTSDSGGAEYPGLGNLSSAAPGLEVFTVDWGRREIASHLQAYTGDGVILAGWPASGDLGSVPVLADLDGDGIDEIFFNQDDYAYHGYRADGRRLPGWPVLDGGVSQRRAAPAIADIDGNGDLEIIGSDRSFLFAYHYDGTAVQGFPKYLGEASGAASYPVVGDVDGDGAQEIVVTRGPTVTIFSATGTVERTLTTASNDFFGTAPALADLTADGVPEIVVQTNGALDVWRGNGTALPGWPVTWGDHWVNNSAPMVGDVDGDLVPDIVITSHVAGAAQQSEIRVYRVDGTLHPAFPKYPPIGSGATAPAIADIDLDGRNEILVAGSHSEFVGYWDYLWAYDLGGGPHGRIEWGQFGGGPHHRSVYPVSPSGGSEPAPSGSPSPGPARLVADIHPGPATSAPSDIVDAGGTILFAADGGGHGVELWRSDGTSAGTFMVKDIRAGPAGSSPRQLTRLGGNVFFVADDGASGLELWKTNGTATGTVLVRDIWPGAKSSNPRELVASGGLVFFAAWDGVHGFELWRSDGTTNGTFMTRDRVASPKMSSKWGRCLI